MQNFRNSLAIAALLLGVASASAQITPPRAGLGPNTFTGQQAISANGAASTPPVTGTGTWFTGGTSTTTKPQVLVEPAGTPSTGWNPSGTGIGVNAASGYTGLLLDLQLNGLTKWNMDSSGATRFYGASDAAVVNFERLTTSFVGGAFNFWVDAGGTGISRPLNIGTNISSGQLQFVTAGSGRWTINGSTGNLAAQNFGIGISMGPGGAGNDLFLNRSAAGTLRIGALDAAAPVSAGISFQGVIAGTPSAVGADGIISAGQGTGPSAGGVLRFRVAPGGAASGVQNSLVDAVVIDSTKLATFSGHTASTGTAPALSACGTTPTIVGTDIKGAITAGTGVVTACTATFATAYTSTPVCVANSNTTGAFVAVITVSTTAITFGTSATIAGGVIYYHCMQ